MGLLDLFSGNAGRQAAMATQQNLAQTMSAGNTLLNQGTQAANSYIDDAQPQALAALGTGYDNAGTALTTGFNAATNAYGEAGDLYSPYAQTGQQGFNMYANALGLNGPGGNAAATAAFQAGPGYRYAVDQSTDALARKASSLGTLGGGNTMAGISDRAGQMANQEYGNWLARLQGIGQTGYNATGAQAGLMRDRGALDTVYGQDLARNETGYGTGVSSIYEGDAARKATLQGATTALGMNSLTDLGKLSAQNTNSGMLAGQTANQNSLNALLGVLGLGAKAAGAYAGA